MGVNKGFLWPFCRKWELQGEVVSERDCLEEDMKKAMHHKSVYLCPRYNKGGRHRSLRIFIPPLLDFTDT